MPTDPSITPNAGPSEGLGSRQGHADGPNGGLALPGAAGAPEARSGDSGFEPPDFFEEASGHGWYCRGGPGCDGGGESYFATAEVARRSYDRHVAAEHAPTPPAAPVPAPQRPEVAGEPESGQDGAVGRVAVLAAAFIARGREFERRAERDLGTREAVELANAVAAAMREFCDALPANDPLPGTATLGEVHAAAVQYAATLSYDGCHRECWKAAAHTLNWGLCAHAVEPPPTASLSHVYTDAEDGQRSIDFDRFTVAELAELIEPALSGVGIRLGPTARALIQDGHEVWLSSDEIRRLALAAADAIVTHSNRDGT